MKEKKKIFCYGDSNTYGYDPVSGLRHDPDVRWTGRLQQMLGEEYQVVEQGCNGRTTVYPEPGAEWKSGLYGLKLCLNTYKPIHIMVLMLGSNDLKDFYHASAQDIAAGAEKLIKEARDFLKSKQTEDVKILLVSPIEIGENMSDSPFGKNFKADAISRSRQFPVLYQAVARKHNCYYLNAAAHARPSKEDSLHMMPGEHAKLAKAIYEAIQKMEGGE